MKNLHLAVFALVIVFAGCNSESSESSTTTTTPQTEETPAPPAQENIEFTNPPHGEPGHIHGSDEETFVPQGGSGEVRLNPPHGEPGHSCEIPVGAPLPN